MSTQLARSRSLPPGQPDRPPAPAARTHILYMLVVGLLAVAVFATVGLVNARLNPYVYDDDAIAGAAQGLVEGKNLANYDLNIDLRKLRKAHIERMPTAPDVVISGDSRWQEARSENVPGGHRVYNAYVSNDRVEDMLAIANILDKANRLPKTMVFSLRDVSLQPIPDRTTHEWKSWESDYSEMARRLGVTPAPYVERAPVQQLSAQYSFPEAFRRWQQVEAAKAGPMLTTESETEDLDIIASDGSLRWSRASRAKFTREFVDEFVDDEVLRAGPTQPRIDGDSVEMLGKLIDWLHNKGVTVVLVLPPYNPDFWQRVQGYPLAETLRGLEAVVAELQAKHGVIAYNRSNPVGYPNCDSDNFVDHAHSTWKCMRDLFNDLPDLTTGVTS